MSAEKPWVDGPFRLIPASSSGDQTENRVTGARIIAAEMTMVHNLIIRGINAIYIQCINVGEQGTEKDKIDFANFATRWGEFAEEHHTMEEESFFPGFNNLAETPGLMDGNIAEHEAFRPGLDSFLEYVTAVSEGRESYDGHKIMELIDSFIPLLHTHLEHEITILVSLSQWDDKVDWEEWFRAEINNRAKAMMAQQRYRTHILPLAFILHDKTYENGLWSAFPPLPWIAAAILRLLFVRVHQDWWRFAGCDGTSMPKKLPLPDVARYRDPAVAQQAATGNFMRWVADVLRTERMSLY